MWATYGTTPKRGGTVFTGAEPVTSELDGQSYATVDHMPDWAAEYMDTDGTLKTRPAIPYTLTGTIFTGLPDPVNVQITGPVPDAFECTGGELSLTFAVPGTYTVKLTKFPYLDAVETIDAT